MSRKGDEDPESTHSTNKSVSHEEETNSKHEKTNITYQIRSSSRERTFTEKGKEMHEQDTVRHKKAFIKAYDSWMEMARKVRTTLK